jgi:hypothetical protein
MKLLTATTRTQGQRDSDFTWCVEGELVTVAGVICGRDRAEGPDGGCGCGRSFGGLNSHKATTTAIVKDVEGFTFDDLLEAVFSYRQQAGWLEEGNAQHDADVKHETCELAELAAQYDTATVLERRLDIIQVRDH